MRASQGPWNRGFEKAFAMLPGCSNHYGWEPVQERFPVGGRPIHAEEGVKVDMYLPTKLFRARELLLTLS
jgi:arylsulfatase